MADRKHPAEFWDVYWSGANAAGAEGGSRDPALAEFWSSLLSAQAARFKGPRVLDLACGDGAVTAFAEQRLAAATLTALDYSHSALLRLKASHRAHCVVGDVRKIPLAGPAFDIIGTQFGVEYAGPTALLEAVPLLAAGGVLAAVLHLYEGAIYRECEAHLADIAAIQHSAILPLAQRAFEAGFALSRRRGSVAAFKQAEADFTPAVRALEKLIQKRGEQATEGLPRRIYQDIAHMYRRMSAYEPADILAWIAGMEAQLHAYYGRMSGMLKAALDDAALERLGRGLTRAGLTIQRCGKLSLGAPPQAAAWVLVAQRAGKRPVDR